MKKMSAIILTGVIGITPMSSMAEGAHEFSANVAITTDYHFRGITQSDENPAIQGGMDYAHESGFYLGTWASSIDFAEHTEFDFYGGYGGELGNGLSYDIGGLYYAYPGDSTDPELDFFEVYGSLSYDFGQFSITGGLNYSPDYFAESGDALYVYGDFGVPLPNDFSINAHIAHQSIDDNVAFGTPDYIDWSIGASKEVGAFTFDISYIGTDLNDAECFGDEDLCGGFVFSVSSSF